MALRVWLPLNGNLENKGISNNTITTSGTPSYKVGKISAQALDLKTRIYFTCDKLANLQTFSICFWGMAESSDTLTSNWQDLLGFTDVSSSGTNGTFRWETTYSSTNGIHWHDNATNALVNGSHTHIAQKDVWCHCCVVFNYEEGKIYTYTNGVLVNTHNHAGGKFNSTGAFYLGETNNIEGRINDVRFYDHALSAKEVKEISQGLVLHYKLDGFSGGSGRNLLFNSKSVTSGSNASGISSSYEEDGSLKVISASGNGNWKSIGFPDMNSSKTNFSNYIQSGTTYTFSCDFKIEAGSGVPKIFINNGNSYATMTGNANLIGQWQRIYITRVYGGTDSSYGAMSPHLGFSGLVGTYYFKNFQIEVGGPTVWSPAPEDLGIDTTKIVDSSGYENNGILTGTLENFTDTSRYQLSSFFNGNDTAIQIPYNATIWQDNFTMNLWFKKDELGSKNYETLIGGPSGFEMDTRANNATTLSLYMASTRGGNVYSPFNFGEWYMVTLVNNGTNELYYVNGALVKTIEKKSMPTGNYFIGAWQTNIKQNYKGDISDFRFYATALSAEDILDLYHTPANIDNLQNIHTFEFQENGEKISIYQNGITSTTDEIHESNAELLNTVTNGGYTPAKNTANSCTSFGYANFDNYASLGQDLAVHIECDVEWTAFTADTGGTFRGVWFQGANYEKASNSFKWAGTNYICSALNSAFSLQIISTITTAGKHHYDIITTIPANWFATYSRSNLGWRCDYSDGTGHIDIKNLKITPLQYYNAKIGEDFISANNFIEK